MSNSKAAKLGELVTEITVGYVGPMVNEYRASGVPFLRSLNVEPGRINTNELKFIDGLFHAKLRKSALRPGDVVIVRTGKPGVASVIPDTLAEANCSDLVIVRPGPNLDPRFLAYYVNSVAQEHVDAHVVGAVQQHFNIGSAKEIEIPLWPLDAQRAVARILGALDDKIELNRRMNRTLETLAQKLFKSWFVDIDPVVAKSEGRKPFGLSDELAALFPSEFEDSEQGPIPKGWRVSAIGQEANVVGGSTPSTDEPEYWTDGQHCWVTPRDLSRLEEPVLLDTERKITDAGLGRISSGLLPLGTVLLSSRAPIGYVAVAGVPTAINQGFIAIQCDQSLPNQFVRQWVSENMAEIEARAGGTTFAEISKSAFRPIPVIVPSAEVLSAYQAQAAILFDRLSQNVKQSGVLARLRDLLLPRLLSGELRVPDAEREVEAVL